MRGEKERGGEKVKTEVKNWAWRKEKKRKKIIRQRIPSPSMQKTGTFQNCKKI